MHRRNASHITHEYKQGHKSEQKAIINLRQRASIKKEQGKGNESCHGKSINKTYYRHNTQSKQKQVRDEQEPLPPRRLGRFFARRAIGVPLRITPEHNQQCRNQHCRRQASNRRHGQHKLKEAHARCAIEEEVLRIPNGQQHTAQICRNRHEHHHRSRMPTLPRLGEHDKGKRNKGDKRHVIGYRHGADEGQRNQRERQGAHRRSTRHSPAAQQAHHAHETQSRYNRHQAKQKCQSAPINIRRIAFVKRHQRT